MQKYFFILLFCLISAAQDGRLNPHGEASVDIKSVNIKTQKACTVCHMESGKLKPNSESSCTNCHNKAPHSGIAEHLGKSFGKEKINCLSCHSPHRFGSLQGEPDVFFKDRLNLPRTEGLEIRSRTESMLKRSCTECHKW